MLKPVEERFWSKVQVGGPDDCWLWLGRVLPGKWGGYGHFDMTSHKAVLAHRFAYELKHGPIPEGRLGCHKCDNPRCVNPEHIFAGTPKENIQDSIMRGRFTRTPHVGQGAKTHCVKGHAFTPENTVRWGSNQQRVCRTCQKNRIRKPRGTVIPALVGATRFVIP